MKRLAVVMASLGGAVGCGTGPDNPDTLFYQFFLEAFGADTTAERIRGNGCVVSGTFALANPALANGTVNFPVHIERTINENSGQHFESTLADTNVTEAVLDYAGLGSSSLSFTFGAGDYTVSPPAGMLAIGQAGTYTGDWSCGPDLPLAHDSTLGVYGFDPNLVLQGSWRIEEIRPIE
jgi:hypothetical protein